MPRGRWCRWCRRRRGRRGGGVSRRGRPHGCSRGRVPSRHRERHRGRRRYPPPGRDGRRDGRLRGLRDGRRDGRRRASHGQRGLSSRGRGLRRGFRLGLLLAREPRGLPHAVGVRHHRTTRGPVEMGRGRKRGRRRQVPVEVRARKFSRTNLSNPLSDVWSPLWRARLRGCDVVWAMAGRHDRGKTRRVGSERKAGRSAIQSHARAPLRAPPGSGHISQEHSPNDCPLGGGAGLDAAVAPRGGAASRPGGRDGVSPHGGAGNHIL